MPSFRILLVDDSRSILKALERLFRYEGYEIALAEGAGEALKIMSEERIDLIVSDQNMPGISGTQLLKQIRDQYPETFRIMLTGLVDIEVAQEAINSGEIYRFFVKPWDDFELLNAVRQANKQWELERENARLRSTLENRERLLQLLEKKHPGITDMKRDHDGAYVIDG